jgi:uncharacterized protein DUF6056
MDRSALLSDRLTYCLVLSTSLAVLVPALALAYFAEPVADDFARATVVDVPKFVGSYYVHWSGRWAAVGLEAFLLSMLPMLSVYAGILWGLQVVHFLALLAYWHMLLGKVISLRHRLGLALTSFVFLLVGYPNPGETVYWVPGGVEYQLPVSLALLLLATVCASTRFPVHPSRALPRALALGLLGFAITGLHELAGLMLLAALFTVSALVLIERRPNLGIWLILLVFVALGTALTLLAPGNAERAAIGFPHGRSVSPALVALAKLIMRILRWIDLKFVAASVLLALTLGSQLRPSQHRSTRGWLRVRATALAGGTILLGNCAVIAYVTGGTGPGRSQNLLYMTFCIVWFTFLVSFLKAAPHLPVGPQYPLACIGRSVVAVFFCFSLLTSLNQGIVMRDLLFDAVPWERAMNQRYELMRRAARVDGAAADVVVPPIVPPATFYRDLDIGADALYTNNRLLAEYFGVRSVRVGEPSVLPLQRPTDLSPARRPRPPGP